MNIESIYFKGHSCFKKEWAGFDTIKPVNVIIGRNNSGKSHLLDLVESLCGGEPFDREWQYQCSSVFDEESLKKIFSEEVSSEGYSNDWRNHGQYFVGKEVTWEFTTEGKPGGERLTGGSQPPRMNISNVKYPDDFDITYGLTDNYSPQERSVRMRHSGVHRVLSDAMHQLNGTSFSRLFADRDIKIEPKDIKIELGRDGQGATNIICRFITFNKLPREVIEKDLLDKLKLIFDSDSQFLDIGVQELDDRTDETDDRADETGSYWEVYLYEEKKGWIPLSRSGSGLKTVILVLLNLLVVPKIPDERYSQYKYKSPFTFAFEELENNLHPALLRRLFQYLEEYAVSEKATIFLTTHSSIALDFFGTSDHAQIIHVSHDGESARTTTIPTHSGYLKIISELGVQPSDLLQVNGLIWVEGPSDRIYLNRWIELYTDGRLREGRDYQCVFYGGSILSQVQFKPPEDEATKLANLFQINHNFIVVCDGDRTAGDSGLKSNVERIRAEVEKIDGAHIWITEAKEIENYLLGSVLEKVTGLSCLPDPGKYESWSSYTKKHMQRKGTEKVGLAISSTQYMTSEVREVMEKRFDWKEQMEEIVKRIDSWNENSPSEEP